MPQRKNITIKTKYKTIQECKANCVDGEGTKFFAKSWSNKLYGVFKENQEFLISSDAKGAALFEFKGHIIEKEDGIYLKGDIYVKPRSQKMVYGSILLGLIFGGILMSTFNVVFLFMGVMFMIVPWFNLIYIKRSDVIYQMIEKKVL